MDIAAMIAAVTCILLVGFYVYLQHQARLASRFEATIEECLTELSAERYVPMLRLLSQTDLEYVRLRPGSTAALSDRLRKQRYQTFRGYMETLRDDYQIASRLQLFLLLRQKNSRPDQLGALLLNRLLFIAYFYGIRCGAVAYQFGQTMVDGSSLIMMLDGAIRQLRPVPVRRRAPLMQEQEAVLQR